MKSDQIGSAPSAPDSPCGSLPSKPTHTSVSSVGE